MKSIRRLPRWIPPLALFLTVYFALDVIAYVALTAFELHVGRANRAILTPQYMSLKADLALVIAKAHEGIIGAAAVVYGLYRSMANHPFRSPGYRTWLKSTPWQPGMPLPLGPATVQWWDGLVVVGAVVVNNWNPGSSWMQVLLPACIAYSVGSLATLVGVGRWEAYVLGLGGSGLFWAFPHIPVMLALALPMAIIGHEGLRRSLHGFPWESEKKPSQTDPWPLPIYEDVKPRVTTWQALLTAVMVASWWGALLHQLALPFKNVALLSVLVCFFASFSRWLAYCGGYRPPLTFLARITHGRLILPGYDHVLIVPTIGIVLTFTLPFVFHRLGLPLPAIGALSVGVTLAILLIGGPTFRVWQLTGYHRITGGATGKAFIAKT